MPNTPEDRDRKTKALAGQHLYVVEVVKKARVIVAASSEEEAEAFAELNEHEILDESADPIDVYARPAPNTLEGIEKDIGWNEECLVYGDHVNKVDITLAEALEITQADAKEAEAEEKLKQLNGDLFDPKKQDG